MEERRKKIIEQIRKLQEIAQPESNAFSGEISNASAMIQKLMDKYSISEMELALAESEKIEDAFIGQMSDARVYNILKWHWRLARLVGRVTHTKHYSSGVYSRDGIAKSGRNWKRDKRNPKRVAHAMCFYGSPDNVAVAAEMYFEWLLKIETISIQAVDEYIAQRKQFKKEYGFVEGTEYAEDGRVFRRSWIDGCLGAISDKIYEQEKSRDAGDSTSLVIYQEKVDGAYKIFSEHFRTVGESSASTFSSVGYKAGQSVGASMSLTPTKKISTGTKLLKGG